MSAQRSSTITPPSFKATQQQQQCPPLPFWCYTWRRQMAMLAASVEERQSALIALMLQAFGARCHVHTSTGTFMTLTRIDPSIGVVLQPVDEDVAAGPPHFSESLNVVLRWDDIATVSLERYSSAVLAPSDDDDDDDGHDDGACDGSAPSSTARAFLCIESSTSTSTPTSAAAASTEVFLILPVASPLHHTQVDEEVERWHRSVAYMNAVEGVDLEGAVRDGLRGETWVQNIAEHLAAARRRHRLQTLPPSSSSAAATNAAPTEVSGGLVETSATMGDDALLSSQVQELQRILAVKEALLVELEEQLRLANTSAAAAADGGGREADDGAIPLVFTLLRSPLSGNSGNGDDHDDDNEDAGAVALRHHRAFGAARPRTAGGLLLSPDAQLADAALAMLPDRPSYSPHSDEDGDVPSTTPPPPHSSKPHPTASSSQPPLHRSLAAAVTDVRFSDVLVLGDDNSAVGAPSPQPRAAGGEGPTDAPHPSYASSYFSPSSKSGLQGAAETSGEMQHEDDAAPPLASLGVSPIRRYVDAYAAELSPPPPALRQDEPHDDTQRHAASQRPPPTRGTVVRPHEGAQLGSAAARSSGGRPLTSSVMHFLTDFTGRGVGSANRRRQPQALQPPPLHRDMIHHHGQRPQQRGRGGRVPAGGAAAESDGGIASRQLGLGSIGAVVRQRSDVAHDPQLLRAFDDIHGRSSSSSSDEDAI